LSTPWLTSEEFQEVKRFDIHKDDSLPFELQFAADAAAIEARVEKVRARLAPAPEDGVYKTPDEMVDDLEWAKYGTGQLALALKQAGSLMKDARARFAKSHAIAVRRSDGKSEQQREADALLQCQAEQLAMDVTETALQYAKDVARAIEQTGSMTQTQASLVRAQMALAGSGRDS
jgi:hypothetical protein